MIADSTILVQNRSFQILLQALLSCKVPVISVAQAAKEKDHFVFLDAREQEEYEVSHIPGAVFIGYECLNEAALKKLSAAQPLVVYCSIGKRSENITQKLQDAGYTNVYNLYGGIFEWVNQGHCIYDSENQPTNQVHAYSRFWGQWLENGEKVY